MVQEDSNGNLIEEVEDKYIYFLESDGSWCVGDSMYGSLESAEEGAKKELDYFFEIDGDGHCENSEDSPVHIAKLILLKKVERKVVIESKDI